MTRLILLLTIFLPVLLRSEPVLDARIRETIVQGAKPVVFVDLDATLFSESARLRHVLEAYDRNHGTKHFEGADWNKFTTFNGLEDSVVAHLKTKGLDAATFADAKKTIMAFEFSRRFHPESIKNDVVYQPLKDAIGKWEAAGAEVIFLTGRDQSTRPATEQKLATEGLSRYKLITKQKGLNTAVYKADTIDAYARANPQARVVALLDDAIENLQVVHEAHPELLALRTTQATPNSLDLDAPLDAPLFETIVRYARNYAKWKFEFIPSRKRLHASIVKGIAGTATPSPQPLLLFTSGSFGSGKSTTIGQLVDLKALPAEHFNWIDPDRIRDMMPEYATFKALDPVNAGTLVHREVGLIQEDAFEEAMRKGQSIIVEGTLRSYDWNKSEFDRIRKMYPQYRIGILALKADETVAAERLAERAKVDKRVIPPGYVAAVAKEVPETLAALEPFADFTIEVHNNEWPTLKRIRTGNQVENIDLALNGDEVRKQNATFQKVKALLSPRVDLMKHCLPQVFGTVVQPAPPPP